jgi:hypothetical protein
MDSESEKQFNERFARLKDWNENFDRSLDKSRQERAIAWRELDFKLAETRQFLNRLARAVHTRGRLPDNSEPSQNKMRGV